MRSLRRRVPHVYKISCTHLQNRQLWNRDELVFSGENASLFALVKDKSKGGDERAEYFAGCLCTTIALLLVAPAPAAEIGVSQEDEGSLGAAVVEVAAGLGVSSTTTAFEWLISSLDKFADKMHTAIAEAAETFRDPYGKGSDQASSHPRTMGAVSLNGKEQDSLLRHLSANLQQLKQGWAN